MRLDDTRELVRRLPHSLRTGTARALRSARQAPGSRRAARARRRATRLAAAPEPPRSPRAQPGRRSRPQQAARPRPTSSSTPLESPAPARPSSTTTRQRQQPAPRRPPSGPIASPDAGGRHARQDALLHRGIRLGQPEIGKAGRQSGARVAARQVRLKPTACVLVDQFGSSRDQQIGVRASLSRLQPERSLPAQQRVQCVLGHRFVLAHRATPFTTVRRCSSARCRCPFTWPSVIPSLAAASETVKPQT